MLRDLVLVDCPDPDTTEEMPSDSPEISYGAGISHAQSAGTATPQAGRETDSNLARLRKILPHCDVLLVTATQQKYRSARVAEELAAAAAGARLVFVQTHADVEDDIRDDWRAVLADQYAAGTHFFYRFAYPPWPTPNKAGSRGANSPSWSIYCCTSWPVRRATASAGRIFSI